IGVRKHVHVNWDELRFSLTPTDYIYKAKTGDDFLEGTITPLENIELNPCLKAYRKEDGSTLLFRPEQNAQRMQIGAERMCMKAPSVELFVDAVKQTVIANKRWVPPPGKGSIYVRPILVGSGPILRVGASPDYIFLVFATPVVEDKFHRAALGGTGGVKVIGNYSPTVKVLAQAKAKGFLDVVFLDSVTGKYIEEASSCSSFIVKGNVITTPGTNGNILPGFTRKSIIELAKTFHYHGEERDIPMADLSDADEVL
ncbi:hypothetical protein SLEP1_g60194, partial [Rubroshorea leprosula]